MTDLTTIGKLLDEWIETNDVTVLAVVGYDSSLRRPEN